MSDKVPAWHFVGDRLRDGRPVPADGETLTHDGPMRMCASGLHASERLMDALQYAPGATLCRVDMCGDIERAEDKLVARKRRIRWRIDAEPVLREFARKCALSVVHLWDAPANALRYLETGDEGLRAAASDAARAAAWTATCDARDAAWDAADAAWAADAACDVADAAWGTASAAARGTADAARNAAWAAAAAARAAASAVASAAARHTASAVASAAASAVASAVASAAAREAQEKMLTEMVEAAHRAALEAAG